MRFDYTGVNVKEAEKCKCVDSKCSNAAARKPGVSCSVDGCETFEDCPRSIEIKGDYLVALYSTDILGEETYCRTFSGYQDVPDLGTTDIIAPGSIGLDNVYIFPIH